MWLEGERGSDLVLLRRSAAALLCAATCAVGFCVLGPGAAPRELARGGAVSSLDARLRKILNAEHQAAGAIDVLWRETNQEPAGHPYDPLREAAAKSWPDGSRDKRMISPGGDEDADGSWSAKMAQSLQRLNELTLPEAEAIAPTNLDLDVHQNEDDAAAPGSNKLARSAAVRTQQVGRLEKEADTEEEKEWDAARRQRKGANFISSRSSVPRKPALAAVSVPASAAVSAVQAEAAARVQKVIGSVKRQEAGTQQLVATTRASFFEDAVNNLAAAKKAPRSHLSGRTMMLADETPAGGEDTAEQAADTVVAVEDAVADGHDASEEQLGDTLQGHWHAPMWPGGSDEGSPVLTSTIAAPGQGGEYAYGFPYDEAKLFSLEGGNAPAANATGGGGLGDDVEAAENEATDEGKPGAQQVLAAPFYQGVGAGGQQGPSSQGGWNGNELPPAMPDDMKREEWLKTRANGFADEFSSAARAITHTGREQAMARENTQDEQADHTQGALEDSHISQLRANIAKFVAAFDTGGAQPLQGGEDGGAVNASQGDHALRSVQSQKLAIVAAKKVAERTAKLSDEGMGDKEFLAKFNPPRVDEHEDFACGWPGPPCADPATGVRLSCVLLLWELAVPVGFVGAHTNTNTHTYTQVVKMMRISRGQAMAMATQGASLRVSFGGFRPRARASLQSWRRAQVGVQQLPVGGGGAPKIAMRSWPRVCWHRCGSRGGGVRATTLMRRCRNSS